MEIDTKPFGTIEIDEDKIVTLKEGLLGFENRERFVIIGREEEQPFEWLQSVEDGSLAFVVCQANTILPNYQLSILREDLDDIDANSEEDITVYLIVVVPDDPDEMTVNLKGPIVINSENYVGKQIINQVDEYGVRHRLLDVIEDQSTLQMSSQE
jgi:flagellar assembly factor FliW